MIISFLVILLASGPTLLAEGRASNSFEPSGASGLIWALAHEPEPPKRDPDSVKEPTEPKPPPEPKPPKDPKDPKPPKG